MEQAPRLDVRLSAALIDGFFLIGVNLVIGLFLVLDRGGPLPSIPLPGGTTIHFAPPVVELLLLLALPLLWKGKTVGKRACGLRITPVHGSRLHAGHMLLRTLGGVLLYTLTLGAGLLVSFYLASTRPDRRMLHDLLGGTRVAVEEM
ncbi:RDD family protein [Alkalicoccus urumqiensis]|uniref:RDD family protein n=1 Tax=Alkalicoccus urumqiensis TaxID=1548213 RepID=A0A2P6MJM1_ALKUR|nr:RDD family protein [Alkalicoccus urumqiensis]PRO66480.1 RDD family protein [Alkalicoccus urumqiensis]